MYNYREEMADDVANYISENGDYYAGLDRDALEIRLNDDLWAEDSVTGNGSGSYTFNAYQAGLNLAGNYDLLHEACEEFGCGVPEYEEAADVTIRCYLLGEVISDVLDDLESDGYFDHDEEEQEAEA